MKKLAKAVTAVLAVGALGTLVFMRMTKKEEPMEAVPDPSVQVENPAADTISISTDLTGTVEPARMWSMWRPWEAERSWRFM